MYFVYLLLRRLLTSYLPLFVFSERGYIYLLIEYRYHDTYLIWYSLTFAHCNQRDLDQATDWAGGIELGFRLSTQLINKFGYIEANVSGNFQSISIRYFLMNLWLVWVQNFRWEKDPGENRKKRTTLPYSNFCNLNWALLSI